MEKIQDQKDEPMMNNFSQETKPDDSISSDPIYDFIELEEEAKQIIETNQFKRLQNICQLGPMYLIQPEAGYKRYDHCIGTYHISKEFLDSIEDKQKADYSFDDYQVRNVRIAGLCHDLGHGPFSHTFDNSFIQKRFPELNWCHEKCSTDLFEYMIDENSIDDFEKEDIRMVQDLIMGKPTSDDYKMLYCNQKRGESKRNPFDFTKEGWMFDIVNNKRNTLDVDKLDYLRRDSYYIGCMKKDVWVNPSLSSYIRVIDNQICYNINQFGDVKNVFNSRSFLFANHYCGDDTSSLDLMISDIFFLSNDYYQYDKILQNKESYCNLTDNILYDIYENPDPRLNQAREIVNRLFAQEFYKCASSVLIPQGKLDFFEKIDVEKVCTYAKESLSPDDIRIQLKNFNSDEDPMLDISFFSDENPDSAIKLTSEELQTQDSPPTSRLYCFVSDTQKETIAKEAFERAVKDLTGEWIT